MTDIVPPEQVEKAILILRGRRVMFDVDLAELYGVDTRSLIQALKRNTARFPDDFMSQLTDEKIALLRSQNVITAFP